MEYVYAALMLHSAGKKVDEANVKKVVEAAGETPDDAKIKALVASLEGVNIDEAMKKAVVTPTAPAPAAEAKEGKPGKEKKEKEPEEEKKTEEEAAGGLASLFG